MIRLRLSCLALGLASALSVSAATRNWLAQPELYCSPIPRPRHGKTGVLKAKRAARKYKRRRCQQ
ncbi:hypothetical protein B9K09_03505 [Pseudomonas sp. M30-35]|nr:hypothetical protein B9K09_03505 [Pseudomonas sp. M30-35]